MEMVFLGRKEDLGMGVINKKKKVWFQDIEVLAYGHSSRVMAGNPLSTKAVTLTQPTFQCSRNLSQRVR